MSKRCKKKPVEPEEAGSRKVSVHEHPGPAVVAALLCGPVALIAFPAFWWFGYTVLQALLLTFSLQFIVFLFIIVIGFYRSSEDTDEKGASEKDGNPAVSDIQIWRSYSHPDGNGHTPRIALIADNSVQTRQIATDLAQQGYDAHHTTDIDAMFETVQTHPDDWDFMIFDLDLFDELEANVDELISFREDCSTLPVLLLSSSTSKDEFSDHRRAIGDATLRKPVFRNRLLIGIDAMKVNWKARNFA